MRSGVVCYFVLCFVFYTGTKKSFNIKTSGVHSTKLSLSSIRVHGISIGAAFPLV